MKAVNPLNNMLSDYFEKGSSLDNESILNEYGLKRFNLQNKYGFAVISLVVVTDKGLGNGTRIMTDLIDWADINNIHMALTPSTAFGASSVSRLTCFYKRFGFVENKGRNKEFNTCEAMIRKPTLI